MCSSSKFKLSEQLKIEYFKLKNLFLELFKLKKKTGDFKKSLTLSFSLACKAFLSWNTSLQSRFGGVKKTDELLKLFQTVDKVIRQVEEIRECNMCRFLSRVLQKISGFLTLSHSMCQATCSIQEFNIS